MSFSGDAHYFETREGAYDLSAHMRQVGPDYLVALWGGQRPHIGAVAVARPGGGRSVRLTVSVIRLPGHKEGDIAREIARKLSAGLNATVVVTAGMHWSHITKAGISKVVENSRILTGMMLKKIGMSRKHQT